MEFLLFVRYDSSQMRLLPGNCPAVSHDGVKGCGYSFDGVQRYPYGQESYIPLRRRPAPPVEGNEVFCLRPECGDRTHHACWTCSAECKLDSDDRGSARGRANATALIEANGEFLEELERDRYCTHCRRFYNSVVCGAHAASHHPGRGDTIPLIRQDGRVLTPVNGLLPDHVLAGVQPIEVAGQAMVQVVPSDHLLDDLVDGFGICLADGCYQSIGDGFESCSVRCQALLNHWINA